MPLKQTINKNRVEMRIQGAAKASLPKLTEEILNSCNQYCKEDDEGTMIQSSYIHSVFAEGKIVWQTPYAKRQYWEIQTAYKHPNPQARWKWAAYAKAQHREEWAMQAARLMGENL